MPAPAPFRGPRLDTDQAPHVVIPWLVRLRWVSVLALAAAAWAAHDYWHVRLPALSLIALAALAATNAALAFQLRSPAPRRAVVGAVLLVDVGLLTGILYLVGGPINPFSIVYLVGITVAAVALGYRWAIALGIVSNVAYGFTFFHHRPLEFVDPSTSGAVLTLHLYGMWVAFGAATGLIAYFVGRVSEALAERERELTATRAAASKSERLAALFALGAGAAHELATPLSTISTAAGELERAMVRRATGASSFSDGLRPSDSPTGSLAGAPTPRAARQAHSLPLVRSESDYITIIRGEVERCTRVLDQLSGRASPTSSAESQILVSQLMSDVRYRLGDSLAQRLDIGVADADQVLAVPAEPLRQVLVALLRNAFDASSADQRVALRVAAENGVRVEVIDRGRGMNEEEASRAGEPFFTTKPAGAGLGLGLFLVRAFADQMGGTLRLTSTPGQGTSAILHLPARS